MPTSNVAAKAPVPEKPATTDNPTASAEANGLRRNSEVDLERIILPTVSFLPFSVALYEVVVRRS